LRNFMPVSPTQGWALMGEPRDRVLEKENLNFWEFLCLCQELRVELSHDREIRVFEINLKKLSFWEFVWKLNFWEFFMPVSRTQGWALPLAQISWEIRPSGPLSPPTVPRDRVFEERLKKIKFFPSHYRL